MCGFFMPELPGVTDFSDLVSKVGKEKAKELFNQKISKLWINHSP